MKTFDEKDFYGNLNLGYDVIPFISRFYALLSHNYIVNLFAPFLKKAVTSKESSYQFLVHVY